jgi:hypothetical protein
LSPLSPLSPLPSSSSSYFSSLSPLSRRYFSGKVLAMLNHLKQDKE